MKKRMVIILSVLLVLSALALSACGESGSSADLSDSKYVGTWKASGVTLGGESENFEDEIVMTLKEDGTGTLSSGSDTSTFNWKIVDNGFKTSGDVKMTFKDDGENIKTSIFGVDLSFVRQ